MELKIAISQKGKIFEGKSQEIINDALTSAMYEATAFLEREVKKRTPIGVFGAAGGLKASIHGEVISKGAAVVKGIVGHQSVYGDVIEKGRRAGKAWPPEGSLLRWMEVKLGMDSGTAKRMEFIVRRKIGKKGFTGAFMFEKAFNENINKIQKIFDNAGFEIAKALNE